MYRYWDPPYFFLFCHGSLLLLTSYFSSLFWKISWSSPFPYLVSTWPYPILILPLHVHWFTTIFNYDPSLTMTSFLIPIIYNVPLSATSIEFWALSSNERSFHWNKLNSGNGETMAEFSQNYVVPQTFVKDYVDHLAQIEMWRKSKVLKVKGSKFSSWNKITMTLNESNCIFDQMSSLKVHELNLYLVHQRIVF